MTNAPQAAAALLRRNLDVLAGKNRRLAERLGFPVGDEHVVAGPGGALHYRQLSQLLPLELTDAEVRAAVAAAPPGQDSFVFGLGLGELAAALLERDGGKVSAWDKDPWLFRLALSRHDFTGPLRSGRLRLSMGSDLVGLLEGARARPRVVHPLLGRLYASERHLLEHGLLARRAYVCAGGLFVEDLCVALREEGYSPLILDLQLLSAEEMAYGVAQVRPALIAAINYPVGLAAFGEEARCPVLVWEVDPSVGPLPEREGRPGTRVFTYRRANVEEFRRAGFANAEYLPLAADPVHRAAPALTQQDRERYACDVSFVGSSMVDQAKGFERDFLRVCSTVWPEDPSRGPAVLRAVLEAQREDFSRYLVPQALRALCVGLPEARLAELERFAGEIASSEKRVAYASGLGSFGVHLWGDPGWRSAEGFGARYRGSAGHSVELNRIYAASRINVDVGRLYQSDIVTMRVFDVLACGALILVEHSEALAELFEVGREVESYRTLDELREKVSFYLAHPEQAQALAERGRAAVLARHTIRQRVRQMLATL